MTKPEDRGGGTTERSGSGLRSAASLLFTVALLAATGAALYNVFGVSVEIEALASETACQGQGPACKAQFTYWERSPIAHTFAMQTPQGNHPVVCKREYILAGAWSCKGKDGAATATAEPSPSASAAPSTKAPAKAGPAKTPGKTP
ncbi:hypothetical protein [Polyangium sorediatum]|uniref:Uncharacterized protein n=1 Tax=Polyangium sorediatum TaxID=889274 RepID=A0ABT6NPT5_9BACT|nr:hypothetical protein [Polyangium sorediatum]MDI1430276.1 hypothetical protein [Polyangium sorediatum]